MHTPLWGGVFTVYHFWTKSTSYMQFFTATGQNSVWSINLAASPQNLKSIKLFYVVLLYGLVFVCSAVFEVGGVAICALKLFNVCQYYVHNC